MPFLEDPMLLMLISLAAHAAAPQQLDLADSNGLSLSIPAGSVTIVDGEALTVSLNQRVWDDDCKLTVDEGGTTSVTVRARRSANCIADVIVTLPAEGRARVELADGEVTVQDTRGAVDLLLAEGTVTLDGARGSVFAAVETGSLRGAAAGGLIAHVGEGSVSVGWEALPSGDISVQTRKGDVTLTLPSGVALQNEGRDPATFRAELPGERSVSAESRRGEVAVVSG